MKDLLNMQLWRLIRDDFNDGFYNMAADEAIADAVEKGISPPTLRFYGWEFPTLSIGYSQKLDNKIDTEYCRKNKIDIVQRATGGRAVLHDKEVTYSLISPKNNPLFPDNISGTYKIIGEALLKGLSFLNVAAKLSIPNPELRTPNSELKNPSCFATTSKHEIVVDGKKLIGSAQRRFKNSFLQHGSIPLENNHERLALCLGFQQGQKNKKFVSFLMEKSKALNELNGNVFSCGDVVDALVRGFGDTFNIQFKISPLSEYELELAKKLCERRIISL